MEMIDVLKKLNEISERELTKGETAKKEKIVKSMKKDKAGFEKRYGDDAKAVMYATATKMAKNEAPEPNNPEMKSMLSLYNDPRVKQDPGMRIMAAIRYLQKFGEEIPGFNRAEFSKDQLEMYGRAKLARGRSMAQTGQAAGGIQEAMGDSADLQKIKTAAGGEEMLVKTMFASAIQNGLDEGDFIDSARRMLNMTPDKIKSIIDSDTIAKAMPDSEQPTTEASDTMIGAQQAVEEYLDGDTLVKPKQEVIDELMKRAKMASFPESYELETAAKMVMDKYDDDGQEKYMGDSKLNTNTMENKDKKDIKEAIQMTADTPEEAGMLMQILKMAGVKPMGAEMPSMEPKHGSEMDPGALNKQMDVPGDDAMGSMQMAKMRDMMVKPDMEKQEETFANEPEEKTQDVDSLVNVHSGGLNRQKTQYRKEYPGDNPMAVEDKITEEELANSLRAQYEGFKQAYQEAAKPDYIDLDKDGNKTEPMKKAAKDKEDKEKAKDKK